MASTLKGTPVPTIVGHFGQGIQTFCAQLTIVDIITVLGHTPHRKDWNKLPTEIRAVYDTMQRKPDITREAGISDYASQRFTSTTLPGAFPAISIGFANPIEFVPYQGQDEPVGGIAWIKGNGKRVVLDGLARISGVIEMTTRGLDIEYLEELFLFPVVMYAPKAGHTLDLKQLGQLFYDFNAKQTSVATALAMALDRSDVYIQLTTQLAGMSFFKQHGGVEPRKATLGSKSTAFTTQQTLVRTIRGAMEGRVFQEKFNARVPQQPNLTWENSTERAEELNAFLTVLGQCLGAKLKDRDGLLYKSPGLQVLGLFYHDLKFRVADMDPIKERFFIERAAAIDWSRYNPDWINLLGQPEVDDHGQVVTNAQGAPRVALGKAGANTVRSLIKYLREKTELDKLLTVPEAEAEPATVPAEAAPAEAQPDTELAPEELIAQPASVEPTQVSA